MVWRNIGVRFSSVKPRKSARTQGEAVMIHTRPAKMVLTVAIRGFRAALEATKHTGSVKNVHCTLTSVSHTWKILEGTSNTRIRTSQVFRTSCGHIMHHRNLVYIVFVPQFLTYPPQYYMYMRCPTRKLRIWIHSTLTMGAAVS